MATNYHVISTTMTKLSANASFYLSDYYQGEYSAQDNHYRAKVDEIELVKEYFTYDSNSRDNSIDFVVLKANLQPVIDKFGGKVGQIDERVFHLLRGEVYDIDGHVFFCFGGAHSIDQAYRIPRKSWWPEEIPTDDEIMHGSENLAANLDRIEYVITHEAPAIVRRQIYTHHSAEFGEPLTYKLPSIFDNWLETVMFDAPNFKRWYCGHHHQNENFDTRGIPCTMLYRLEEEIE